MKTQTHNQPTKKTLSEMSFDELPESMREYIIKSGRGVARRIVSLNDPADHQTAVCPDCRRGQ